MANAKKNKAPEVAADTQQYENNDRVVIKRRESTVLCVYRGKKRFQNVEILGEGKNEIVRLKDGFHFIAIEGLGDGYAPRVNADATSRTMEVLELTMTDTTRIQNGNFDTYPRVTGIKQTGKFITEQLFGAVRAAVLREMNEQKAASEVETGAVEAEGGVV